MPDAIAPPPAAPKELSTKPVAVEMAPEIKPSEKAGDRPFSKTVFGKDESKPEKPSTPQPQPPKPDEKKEAQATSDDDTPSEIKGDEKRISHWKRLKEERDAAKKAADEWKAKFDTETGSLRTKAEQFEKDLTETKARFNPEEYEKTKKERDDLFRQVRLLDVTRTPEWQREFVQPMERVVKHAVSQVPEEAKARIEWLLKQPPSDSRTTSLEELTSEMSPLRAGQIGVAIAAYDDIRARMEGVLANEKTVVEAHEQFTKEQREAQVASEKLKAEKEFNGTFESVKKAFAESGFPSFTKIDGNEAHNQKVEAAYKEARDLASNPSPEVRMRLAFGAVMAKAAAETINALSDENKKQAEIISKLQGTLPTGGDKGQQANGEQAVDSSKPFSGVVFGR